MGSTALPGTSASRLEKVVTSCSLGEKKKRKIMKNIVKFLKTPCLQNYENIEDVLEIKQLITRG